MPPRSDSWKDDASTNDSSSRPAQTNSLDTENLLSLASTELESMRLQHTMERSFPPACLRLLHSSSQQNHVCVDCGSGTDVTWASVSYGVTLCLSCSGRHRGLGVRCSYVKSLTLDSWNHSQVLAMLEGGNGQLSQFFLRHKMSTTDYNNNTSPLLDRYKTKAASFYKQHLAKHVKDVADNGVYMGREASREASKSKSRKMRKKGHREQKSQTLPTVEEVKEAALSESEH